MEKPDIVRAWKDEEYRLGLSEAQRALLPANPAGIIQLEDADLDRVAGGTAVAALGTWHVWTYGCCGDTLVYRCGTWHGLTAGCCGSAIDQQAS
jgi:mersacidin/lichenicidin family type 2 lantibiotic